MAMHACNPSTWEAEAGGSQIQGKPVDSIAKSCLEKKNLNTVTTFIAHPPILLSVNILKLLAVVTRIYLQVLP
jgi:hypothetical protein